jgi:hypothetical protein
MSEIIKYTLLISPDRYTILREQYAYDSSDCVLEIIQTGNLSNVGVFIGIFAREIPSEKPRGINLRRFEKIVQEVFQDCYTAFTSNNLTDTHIKNLKQISAAIIYWKMASQGGRAKLKMDNLLDKWNIDTAKQLIDAYIKRDISLFRIGGVRIPTATAFMRFLFPDDFGIMDSRVVGNHTQPNGITTLSLRNDGYINDTKQNVIKYETEYTRFLRSQASYLNELGVKFQDIDTKGTIFLSKFRPCDIEMSLF